LGRYFIEQDCEDGLKVFHVYREEQPKEVFPMSIGWYLNHSDTPNCNSDTNPKTLRHIQAGEELTIDYSKL